MRFSHFFLISILFLLAACGGGSGGSSSSTSSGGSGVMTPPPVQTGTIEVSQSAVNFTAEELRNPPPAQTLNINFDAPRVTVGTLPGEGLPSWLSVDLTQTQDNTGRLEFKILDTNLEPGTRMTTIRMVSSNEAGTNTLDTVDIPVNYTIEPITRLTTNVPQITIELAPIQDPVARMVTLMGEGVTWTATNFDGRVVSVSPSSGTVPEGGQEIEIIITPDQNRLLSRTNYIVTFFDVGARLNSTTLDIEIDLVDGVLTDPLEVSLMAHAGSVEMQSQIVTIDSFDITSAPQINWIVTSDQPWLMATPQSGAIDTSGASTAGSDITVSADPTGLAIGIYKGALSFTNDVSDQVYTFPVNLVIGERNMAASRQGVALSTLSTLEQTISITDNIGTDIPWQATSDAAWLTVTSSGTSGQDLTLTADASGLADNSLSEAVISIRSPLSDVNNQVLVNVGLWNSSSPTEDISTTLAGDGFGAPDVILADPVRPYVYALVHDGFETGTNITSELSAYNVYTGERISGPITTRLPDQSKLIMTDDGASLFVVPASFDGADTQLERFNPSDLTASDLIDLPARFSSDGMDFTRVNGIPYIISSSGGVYDIETNTVLTDFYAEGGFGLVASRNGVACARTATDLATTRLDCYDLLGTGIASMDIVANRRNLLPLDINPSIEAISPDGSVVYIRDEAAIAAVPTDGSQSQLFSIGNAGRIFVSQTGTLGTTEDNAELTQTVVRTYTSNGVLTGTSEGVDGFDKVAHFSGDEGRIILFEVFDQRSLTFIDAP